MANIKNGCIHFSKKIFIIEPKDVTVTYTLFLNVTVVLLPVEMQHKEEEWAVIGRYNTPALHCNYLTVVYPVLHFFSVFMYVSSFASSFGKHRKSFDTFFFFFLQLGQEYCVLHVF